MLSDRDISHLNEKSKRILLIVDGDTSYLYYTGMLLQRLDYSVYTAKTAEETFEIMRFSPPLLVLTEIDLPQMNGIDFLRKIKQEPTTKHVPVLVYTASTDQALKYRCIEAGCAGFLRKPFDPDELYAAVQKATEAKPRSYARLHVCMKVEIGGAPIPNDCCITAISENGMYVSTAQPLPVGKSVPIQLTLRETTIKAKGKVLYSFGPGKGPLGVTGMGIKFTEIKPEDKALLTAFIKKELTQDLPELPQ